ncbi:MAG: SDR family NAD(P)-dependent oxidoreductase [Steroidobacteraceae bacterium]
MAGMLQDKVALVTGAGDGIGRAIALRFGQEGARVVVAEINEAKGRATVERIAAAGGRAQLVVADVRRASEHGRLIDTILAGHGRLDVACNNAGISGAMVPSGVMTDAQWQEVIDLNLTGVFFGVRAQVNAMLKSGGGAIVNIASILGAVGFETTVAYTAAKHGVVGLTQTVALEYGPQGVRINAVGPSFTNTSWLDNLPPEAQAMLIARHPLRRFGKVEEVAALVTFLSSAEASYITGAYYPVDGGYLAQ